MNGGPSNYITRLEYGVGGNGGEKEEEKQERNLEIGLGSGHDKEPC